VAAEDISAGWMSHSLCIGRLNLCTLARSNTDLTAPFSPGNNSITMPRGNWGRGELLFTASTLLLTENFLFSLTGYNRFRVLFGKYFQKLVHYVLHKTSASTT